MSRHDSLGQIVDALEVVAPLRHHGAAPKVPLHCGLPLRSLPPATGASARLFEVAGGERPSALQFDEDAVDVLLILLHPASMARPCHPCVHNVAQQRVALHGHERRLVGPRLVELLSLVDGVVQERVRIGPQPREERHVVGAHQDVDRVDLKQADAIEHPAQVADIDAAARPRVNEALGRERDPARLADR